LTAFRRTHNMKSVVLPVGEALITTSEKTEEIIEKEEEKGTIEPVKESTSRNRKLRHSSSDDDPRPEGR
jgi:hypothetical protein